ncbi:serine O-succinyltransferase-like isoform X2 [Anneissia japonica]|uniref:serine O-succinyltransferase-like isoform X2 n=1 Tax=Anneissia japonica TaxID=1529436 RepID=UPI00142553E4|nr:serine O-succinyltransferase-like isoform X2 [Anneissia japonica]
MLRNSVSLLRNLSSEQCPKCTQLFLKLSRPLSNSIGLQSHNDNSRLQNPPSKSFHRVSPQIEIPDVKPKAFRGLETDFPCLTKNDVSGPEPEYHKVVSGFKKFYYTKPYHLKYNNAVLPELEVAYETWGELNEDKSNAVIIHAGLSASSHAKSHKENTNPGWWEKFVGPGFAVDTNKFFVICTNTIGSCYGTSGPSSINPLTGECYGTTFPLPSVDDMVHVQFLLLDHLGINKLHASVGSSLGGMCSLNAAALYPDRVRRVISISGCARSHPSSIAMRYLQRRCIMTDPEWKKGHYYGKSYPKMGMKLAREIATITYRSGPEWEQRFGNKRIDENEEPSLCPTFSIESYIEYQGETFCNKYDPNSLLYISKAMDLFDMSDGFDSLQEGLSRVKCPVMVIGVQTDILFPVWQQRQLSDLLKNSGNDAVTYYELNSLYGHDTFLLDVNNVGAAVKGHLETDLTSSN